jgi:hypothetical protein
MPLTDDASANADASNRVTLILCAAATNINLLSPDLVLLVGVCVV